jgi:hypothetical protein
VVALCIGAAVTFHDGHRGLTFSFVVVAFGTLLYFLNSMYISKSAMPNSAHVLYWMSTAIFAAFMVGYFAGGAIFSFQSPSIIHRKSSEKPIIGTLIHSSDTKALVYELSNDAPARDQCKALQQGSNEDFSGATRRRTRLLRSADITDIELCSDPEGGPGIIGKVLSLF